MHRFFINQEDITEDKAKITGDDVNHISRVLRLHPGDEIYICDGMGNEYRTTITSISKDSVDTLIQEQMNNESEPECNITLYQGVPKSDKMEFIIQKCVELGIASIVPVLTERSVVRLDKEKDRLKKQERWQKVAEEAAKQSRRLVIPKVDIPQVLPDVLERLSSHHLFMVPWEDEKRQSLKSILQAHKESVNIGFLIGPEGGLSSHEVQQVMKQGGISVTLGNRILRTETAGLAVLTMILYEMDEMGGR